VSDTVTIPERLIDAMRVELHGPHDADYHGRFHRLAATVLPVLDLAPKRDLAAEVTRLRRDMDATLEVVAHLREELRQMREEREAAAPEDGPLPKCVCGKPAPEVEEDRGTWTMECPGCATARSLVSAEDVRAYWRAQHAR
jgi:hypothetical protein